MVLAFQGLHGARELDHPPCSNPVDTMALELHHLPSGGDNGRGASIRHHEASGWLMPRAPQRVKADVCRDSGARHYDARLLVPLGASWCLLVLLGASWCLLVPLGASWCLLAPLGTS